MKSIALAPRPRPRPVWPRRQIGHTIERRRRERVVILSGGQCKWFNLMYIEVTMLRGLRRLSDMRQAGATDRLESISAKTVVQIEF